MQPFRHVACQLIGLAILAIASRCFVLQGLVVPVQVSAGSMAETLLGPHRQFVCPVCEFRYACGLDRPPRDGWTKCPNCRRRAARFDSQLTRPGDALLIDRTAFCYRLPRRWETIVFRCKTPAPGYCIKRVAGLPGESIEIRHGDVYVDGQIARKGLSIQRNTRQLVFDSQFSPDDESPDSPGWTLGADWQGEEGRYLHRSKISREKTNEEISWLSFRPGERPEVMDDYGYNQGESRPLHRTRDLMLSGTIRAQDGGQVWLQASGMTTTRASLDLTRSVATLFVQGEGVQEKAWIAAPGTEKVFHFEWSSFDRALVLAIDGKIVLEYEFGLDAQMPSKTLSPMRLGASSARLSVEDLKIWRDIYYIRPPYAGTRGVAGRPYKLADDELYILGDNSPISDDSRTLPDGAISLESLVGKPYPLWRYAR